MRIFVDECLPRYLKKILAAHEVKTAQEMGWGGVENGPLLRLVESRFDVFLTGDKNLRYQQNLRGRKLSIIVFPSNKLSVVKRLEKLLKTTLDRIKSGEFVEL